MSFFSTIDEMFITSDLADRSAFSKFELCVLIHQRCACLQVESNGTVLSTNWKDVGSKKVEGSPPDGMELKKWEY